MIQTTLRWVTGNTYVGTDSTNHSAVISSRVDDLGVCPSDMLLLSLASCAAVSVIEILAKKRTPVNFMEVIASGEQDPDPPWAFRKIHLNFRLSASGLTEKTAIQVIQMAEERYCSVAATLRGVAEITIGCEILPSP